MATETVTTSLTIGFDIASDDTGANSILSAEVDGREDGENNGETNFIPGDTVGIMLFRSSNVSSITYQLSTSGQLSSANSSQFAASSEVDTFLIFDSTDEASLSYPMNSGGSLTWMGKSLGAYTVLNQATVKLSNPNPNDDEYYVGVMRATYTSQGNGITLSGTGISGEDKYEIFCFWVGEIVT